MGEKLPGEGDGHADGRAEPRQPPSALAERLQAGEGRPAPHPGEKSQRGFLTLLEAAQK